MSIGVHSSNLKLVATKYRGSSVAPLLLPEFGHFVFNKDIFHHLLILFFHNNYVISLLLFSLWHVYAVQMHFVIVVQYVFSEILVSLLWLFWCSSFDH